MRGTLKGANEIRGKAARFVRFRVPHKDLYQTAARVSVRTHARSCQNSRHVKKGAEFASRPAPEQVWGGVARGERMATDRPRGRTRLRTPGGGRSRGVRDPADRPGRRRQNPAGQ